MDINTKLETALLSSSNLSSTIAAAHSVAEREDPMMAMILCDLISDSYLINNKINEIIRIISRHPS